MQRIGDDNLIEKIGAGGMGEVYLAENVHHRKRYALKILPQELARDTGFRQRFFSEARVMSELDHAGIVRVHHMGEDQGTYFLVMDYVTGPGGTPLSLLELLKTAPAGRIELGRVCAWARQIAEGLAHAHASGVVHRDIKPANVLIDQQEAVRITDFGLAKAVGDEFLHSQIHQSGSGHQTLSDMPTIGPDSRGSGASPACERTLSDQPTWKAEGQTSTSSLLGTYDYMSPEQRGELPGTALGTGSDVYSFGVMLFQLLTGRRPTGRKAAADIVTGLSKGWDVIIDRCMEYRPQDRYKDGAELLTAVDEFIVSDPGEQRISRGPWVLIAALLLGFAVAGVYWTWKGGGVGVGDGRLEGPTNAGSQELEDRRDQEARGLRPGGPAQRQTAEGIRSQESGDRGQKAEDRQPIDGDIAQSDLVVIVNCEDTMLVEYALGLLRSGLNETGLATEYIGDSQKAAGTELRAKHAKVLARNACPFIIAKVQAVDQYDEVYGKKTAYSTVSVILELFAADSRSPRVTVPKQELRGSLSLGKARKDALDLAMDEAIKEIMHELE